jgi:hypothetical protein
MGVRLKFINRLFLNIINIHNDSFELIGHFKSAGKALNHKIIRNYLFDY